jgi:hypothetical protein
MKYFDSGLVLCWAVTRRVAPDVSKVRDSFIFEGNQWMGNDPSRTHYTCRWPDFRNVCSHSTNRWPDFRNLCSHSTNDKLSILHGLTTFQNEENLFRNFGNHSPNNIAPHLRKADRSRTPLWETETFQREVKFGKRLFPFSSESFAFRSQMSNHINWNTNLQIFPVYCQEREFWTLGVRFSRDWV